MEIAKMIGSTFFSFVTLFLLTKLIGCRQVSQLSLFDYINGITIGSIAAELAIAEGAEHIRPLVSMIGYASAVFLLSYFTGKSLVIRRIVEGTPVVLLEHDKLRYENFRKTRVDLGEFLVQARVAGYFDLSQVEAAVLEPNGSISFLPKSDFRPATPSDLATPVQQEDICRAVILDGVLREEALHHLGYDTTWLERELRKKKAKSVRDIFLATCSKDGTLTVYLRKP
jgi:uncharacterized membrane protein YcaP (DUF421 family)